MLKTALSLAFVLLAGVAQAQTPPQTPPAQAAPQTQGQSTIPLQPQTPAAAPSPLPGGASSLQETYEDWRVFCSAPNNVKQCTLQEVLSDQKSGQRVLAVELSPTPDGGMTGNLVMPFGLLFSAGVALALDQNPSGQALPFQTCIPAGCLVPLSLDARTIAALRNGSQVKLNTKSIDATAKPLVFNVSLKGFGTALDRALAIVK
ncbi:hypothetical protein GCM10007874_04000 [Labrys miyagiensis]|uniref:Invasion associated locus B family protein n=1 Tax=Labrys miyagiensis TaxID=346912 RepID=A0ABQ6CBR3_9HYPH|nr:invasion associated locus B family protein [Labrys miyagiensis]GLS17385.1 hypothetical protein GCM10007874_04000 [Labrys miyagiensis]